MFVHVYDMFFYFNLQYLHVSVELKIITKIIVLLSGDTDLKITNENREQVRDLILN